MRLVHAHQAHTRQGRMDQLRRERSSAQVLRVVFPSIHQLRIELKFEGPFSNTPTSQRHVLYPPARAFFDFPCPYSDCDGHFDLESAVKTALADGSNAAAGTLECPGSRARDHASKQPCLLQILYEVTAIHHAQT